MKITETKVDGLKHEFKILVPKTDIEAQANKRLMELGKNVKVAGFRPGHIPLPILKQRYAEGIKAEVLEKVIEESTQKLVTEKKLRIALRPDIKIEDTYKDGQDLTFSINLEVLPEMDPIKVQELKVEHLVAEPEEKQIKEALKKIAERNKTLKEVEKKRASQKGDVLTIDFEGKISGKVFEGGTAKGVRLELGSGMFIEGFEDQLIGKKEGEKVDVVVTFPKDYGKEDLAGKEATFHVEIHALEEYETPEIDEAFAKEKGFKDFEELKKALVQQLQEELTRMSFLVAKRRILDHLDESYKVPVPDGLLKAEFDIIWKQYQQEREKEKKPSKKEEEGSETKKKTSKKETDSKAVEEEYRKIAERRVKLGLVLSEIGREHKIQVSHRELERALMDTARNYPGHEKQVIDYYKNNEAALASLRAPIFEDKVISLVLEKGKIQEKKVAVKELEEAVKKIIEDEEE